MLDMYPTYFNSWEQQIWTANGITLSLPGNDLTGAPLSNLPDLTAAIHRHTGGHHRSTAMARSTPIRPSATTTRRSTKPNLATTTRSSGTTTPSSTKRTASTTTTRAIRSRRTCMHRIRRTYSSPWVGEPRRDAPLTEPGTAQSAKKAGGTTERQPRPRALHVLPSTGRSQKSEPERRSVVWTMVRPTWPRSFVAPIHVVSAVV